MWYQILVDKYTTENNVQFSRQEGELLMRYWELKGCIANFKVLRTLYLQSVSLTGIKGKHKALMPINKNLKLRNY